MNPNPSFPLHRPPRLPEYDYSQPGSYFVTIVTQDRKQLFGQIVDWEMALNKLGRMVTDSWNAIPEHFPNVELGVFVVMPNHIHGIISIKVVARHAVPPQQSPIERFGKPVKGSLPTIIRSFKSATTRKFYESSGHSTDRLGQKNYYEHVIRNERDYQAFYDYILANPINWEMDEEFSAS